LYLHKKGAVLLFLSKTTPSYPIAFATG
jgi:hypothetical protein